MFQNYHEYQWALAMLQPRKNAEKLRLVVEWLAFLQALQKNNISESFSEKWSQEPPSEEAIPQEEPKKAQRESGAPGGALGFDIGDLINKHGGIIEWYHWILYDVMWLK